MLNLIFLQSSSFLTRFLQLFPFGICQSHKRFFILRINPESSIGLEGVNTDLAGWIVNPSMSNTSATRLTASVQMSNCLPEWESHRSTWSQCGPRQAERTRRVSTPWWKLYVHLWNPEEDTEIQKAFYETWSKTTSRNPHQWGWSNMYHAHQERQRNNRAIAVLSVSILKGIFSTDLSRH